jgi:hypothetical protein
MSHMIRHSLVLFRGFDPVSIFAENDGGSCDETLVARRLKICGVIRVSADATVGFGTWRFDAEDPRDVCQFRDRTPRNSAILLRTFKAVKPQIGK